MNNDPLSEAAGSIDNKQVDKTESYSDEDIMPFGIYKGRTLKGVSATYLHYLWQHRPLSDRRLEAYILRCLPALREEAPDLIW